MICTGSNELVGLTLSQLDIEWLPHLNESSGPMQERRLTSRHSFLDANPLALPESVSVANPLDGHRNCLTRAIK